MTTFFTKVHAIFADPILRKRVLFTLGALVLFRLAASVPIPGVDTQQLARVLEQNQFLGLLNVFSGSGLSNLSIVMLGVGPSITASIIMQLLTMLSPKLKAMYHEEGEIGRKKFLQVSRLITVPLALMQGFGLLVLLKNQGVLGDMANFTLFLNILIVATGSLLLMWLGELITEFGIGNGSSMIIFSGIVVSIPSIIMSVVANYTPADIPMYLGVAVVSFAVLALIILMTEAERPVPITYAKSVAGGRQIGGVATYLPLRVNQAGVIPIIFALSIFLFPQLIGGFLQGMQNGTLQAIGSFLVEYISKGPVHSVIYFLLVLFFTYFYTAVTFDPDAIAKNLQQSGAFIPGVRPGSSTSEYLARVVARTTLPGAVFLAVIAVLPFVMQAITGNQALAIGGTAVLIVVSVVTELVKQFNAQLAMREY
jgi:preprotein translocase subunit SecY